MSLEVRDDRELHRLPHRLVVNGDADSDHAGPLCEDHADANPANVRDAWPVDRTSRGRISDAAEVRSSDEAGAYRSRHVRQPAPAVRRPLVDHPLRVNNAFFKVAAFASTGNCHRVRHPMPLRCSSASPEVTFAPPCSHRDRRRVLLLLHQADGTWWRLLVELRDVEFEPADRHA